MTLKDVIRDQVVAPALQERLHPIRATILAYSNTRNVANIRFPDPTGNGERELTHVPVQIGSGGMHSAGPFPGDEVWVTFLNGNAMFPRIVSLADEDYKDNTRGKKLKHERQGALVPKGVARKKKG